MTTTPPYPSITDELLAELEQVAADSFHANLMVQLDSRKRAAEVLPALVARIRELGESQRWRKHYKERPAVHVRQVLVPTEDAGIQIKPVYCYDAYTDWMPAPRFPDDFWDEDNPEPPQ